MSTTTGDIEETPSVPLQNAELPTLQRCKRCELPYLPGKSTSELRLTYCSFLCELGDLGFSISGLEHMERAKREPASEAVVAAPAADAPVTPAEGSSSTPPDEAGSPA
jgi:hypothetical protein